MADTVLTELKIREFDSVEQMNQHESEIGENDIALTPDTLSEYVTRDDDIGATLVHSDSDGSGSRLVLTSKNSKFSDAFDGNFELTASNGEAGSTLRGAPNGSLTWSGNPIVAITEFQQPSEANGYTWFIKYNNGWVEQGGQSDKTTQNVVYTVTLPVPMVDANYTATVTGTITGNGYIPRTANRTATSFEIRCDVFSKDANPTAVRLWYVCGMAA